MAKKQMNNYQENMAQRRDIPKSPFGSNMQADKPVGVVDRPSSRKSSITFEQIAERAKSIWLERGCPSNQDEKNWYDAENQLKQELGIR